MRLPAVRIVRYDRAWLPDDLDPQIEALLYGDAPPPPELDAGGREAYRHRRLDRYLYRYPADCFVVLEGRSCIAYLAGCSQSAARLPSFEDVPELRLFELQADYPAHFDLHVRADRRGHGLGRRLVEAYEGRLAEAGAAGVHVTLPAGAAGIGFLERMGFRRLAETEGRVLLGRRLGPGRE